jgi:hypothetical protein
VSLESSETFFGNFYNAVLEERLGGLVESLVIPDGRPNHVLDVPISDVGGRTLRRSSACLVDSCFACNDAELSEFNRILSSKSYYPGDRNWMNNAEKVDDPILFPRSTAAFEGPYLTRPSAQTFIWYYG